MRRDDVLNLLAAHRDEIARFGVQSLALFGSVARDEARPESDVDVLVRFSQPVGFFGLVRLQWFLERLLSRPVDLVTPDGLKPQLRERILREVIDAA